MSFRRRRLSAPLEVVLTPVDSLSGDGFSIPSNRRLPRELLVRRSLDLEASSYPPFRSLWGQGLRIGIPDPFRALGRSYSIRGRVTPQPPPRRTLLARLNAIYFLKSGKIPVCVRRQSRREVLFATGRAGAGAPRHRRHYRRSLNSEVSC